VSDLDLMLALHHEPAPADRADADAIEAALDRAFAQIDGVGIGLCRASTLLSELERHDLGFFVAGPTADPAVLRMLIDDLGPWLAAEYTATHGQKAPRPPPASHTRPTVSQIHRRVSCDQFRRSPPASAHSPASRSVPGRT